MTGQVLRKLRDHMMLTQAELAWWLGVTVTTISRWENGSVPISPVAAKLVLYMSEEPQLTTEEWNQRMQERSRRHEAELTDDERVIGERWFGKH